MMESKRKMRVVLERLWTTSRPLTAVGLLMLAATVASVIGILVDARTITGVPAWLKPFKFAISTAIYSLTLAWVFGYLPDWPRVRRFVGWTTAIVFVGEVAIIDAQAWRGTTSHFNIGTPIDAALFATMGSAIVAQTLVSILVAVALWRQSFTDRALGWALRLGMIITIAGASMGGLMTRPTEAQLAEAQITHRMEVAGAHTVGAPDGGPGLPTTGWSLEHGDLRIPHFLGLHALQLLPLIAFAFRSRRMPEGRRVRAVQIAAASYASLIGVLLWQALRGQSVAGPDATTAIALVLWAGATLFGLALVSSRRHVLQIG